MTQKTITIYDIAKEAEVSPSTVSRILSNSAGVKKEKRERVMQIVEKYHFQPNALAKGLSQLHSKRIGMLCADIRNPYFASIYLECETAAYDKGYNLIFNNTFGREDLEVTYMQKMLEQRVECLIICGGVADWKPLPENYRKALEVCCQQIPVVVSGIMEEAPQCQQISVDLAGGMRQSILHLASLGHQKIAFIHGYNYIYQTQLKIKTFYRVMEELGLPIREEYLVDAGKFDEKSGFQGMNRLLGLAEPPTGVIAINDMMAVGALQAIMKLGYSVPDDISLLGFDDTFLTELTQPNITSIHFDYGALGRMLIDAAVRAIEGQPPLEPILVPATLTIRDSCRKI